MTQRAQTASARGSETYEVAKRWFDNLTSGNIQEALRCLDPDVEWINYTPVPGYNDAMPWIGTYRGVDAVFDSFKVFTGVCDVQREELVSLVAEGDEAAGVVRERSVVRATGRPFEIEFVQWLRIRDGRIVRWKSYTDPSPILAAMRGGGG